MRIIVQVQALFDDGELAWHFGHDEIVVAKTAEIDPTALVAAMKSGEPLPPDVQEAMELANSQSAGDTLQKLLDYLDLARESILEQAAADMVGSGDAPPGS